jgi:hypothetical protein
MTHTPGPWEVSKESDRYVIQHAADVGKKAIAVTAGAYPDSAANAALLAAAPGLYEALRAIVDRDLTYFDGFVGDGQIRAQEVMRARAALAKVKETT